jgi:hypothetical protein
MTRIAIRHTFLSVVTAAMLSPLAPSGSIVLAQDGKLNTTIAVGYDERGKPKSPKALATKKGSHSSMAKPHPSTGLTSPVGFNQGLLP